ncbi:hypothetical protein HNE_3214 [Hyphomonas neptunium ATCC 15444]|uniref:Lipoprotein n=2 Tax=Hyphomonas TaxID=85 RepID=Q0BXA4_HYPNA|nr:MULTISPECIES: hypothetical protein [Hyphomonas]ABI75530.1 hypothetical protein HNE_3214 [Hyphomonas neptunium ATCC 15444]KCZ86916.1 hypothetical protein HHI_16627 [Hyphomonas hirschiana VP5]
MTRRIRKAAVVLVCMSAGAVLPAAADCDLFSSLVTQAETGRGFEEIVAFRSVWDLRETGDTVPAEQAFSGFDVCWVEDDIWKPDQSDYGAPRYVCRIAEKPDAEGTLSFDSHIAQLQAMGRLSQTLEACVTADERFKADRQTSRGTSYIMKPELTEMRGMYQNPRAEFKLSPMEDAYSITGMSDALPADMRVPMQLDVIIAGPARNLQE